MGPLTNVASEQVDGVVHPSPHSSAVEPLVVVSEHPAEWVRPKIELEELARLRQDGLTLPELMVRDAVSRTTLKHRLRQIRE